MWAEIISSIILSISESLCVSLLDKAKAKDINKKLFKYVNALLSEFADTSLDCNEFQRMVEGSNFKTLLNNYFYLLSDSQGASEYNSVFVKYIKNECKSCSDIEIRNFLIKLEHIYKEYLIGVISGNNEISALFRLISVSQRSVVNAIAKSQMSWEKYLSTINKEEIHINDETIKKYHEVCEKGFNTVRFTGISGVEGSKQQDLKDLYVENTFTFAYGDLHNEYKQNADMISALRLEDIFKFCNRIVLVGGAGSGKTTTLNYVFCNYESIFKAEALKIKINLKDYTKCIYEDKSSIIMCLAMEFAKRISSKEYSCENIAKIISDYLDGGKCLVILDALDEISSQPMREKVRDEIEAFCRIYSTNRFIISTREVGYLRNKFDDSFLHLRINAFNKDQIRQYSKNWFRVNNDAPENFDKFWDNFNQEVARAKCEDIISNPIMLILALVIFDIGTSLPNRRIEFYKKCIDTFLITRELRRATLDSDEKVKNILGDDRVMPKVAYYKFEKTEENNEYVFTYSEYEKSVLSAIDVPDAINWFDPIKRYTNYIIERTELINEVNENVLDFAHKTFFEYFLAAYFTKEFAGKELIRRIRRWIGDSNNDELAQLIIEAVIERNDREQHGIIVSYLFNFVNENCENVNKYNQAMTMPVFRILINIYQYNILLAKYHMLYHKFLLEHPVFVHRFMNRREYSGVTLKYDEIMLSQAFSEHIKADPNSMYEISQALFEYGDKFSEIVAEEHGRLYKCIRIIANGFKKIQHSYDENAIIYGKENLQKNIIDSIRYVVRNEPNMIKKNSLVYLAVVGLLSLGNHQEIGSELFFQYKFERCSVFTEYTTPIMLYTLAHKSMENSKDFLIFLITIIQCAMGRANYLIAFASLNTRSKISFTDAESTIKIRNNLLMIFSMLYNTRDYDEFVEMSKINGVYDAGCDIIYKRLYTDYITQEKSNDKEWLIDQMDRLKKEQ